MSMLVKFLQMFNWFQGNDEEGQTLVEYALILVLIAIVVIVVLKGLGLEVNTVFSKANSALSGATGS